MFIGLWNYLKGYVIINVTGFSVERFVNMAVRRGVYIWDIVPYGNGVSMKVGIKGFYELKIPARKTKCKIKIIKRCGLPFRSAKFKGREVLSSGALVFLAGLYILSSFVWVVDVSGNKRIAREDILSAAKELGLYPGGVKKNVDTGEIGERLIEDFKDISWISVGIKGTSAYIKIVETIPETKIVDTSVPSDIIAKKDGIIESIATLSGSPMVLAGDVVSAGDVLVSGELFLMDGETVKSSEYVRSNAKISARVFYEFNESVPLKYTEKVYDEKEKEDIRFIAFNRNINIISPDTGERECDKEKIFEYTIKIGDFALPLTIIKEKIKFYDTVLKERSEDEAKALLESGMYLKTDELLGVYGEVKESSLSFERNGSDIFANLKLTVLENIGEERFINSEGGNAHGVN
ncbi:MAG: sporulation protein YqfD [Lachnospiraceae bacterium]|nr:sporulation protein YqfD [Lachnospiraceae bacterium]